MDSLSLLQLDSPVLTTGAYLALRKRLGQGVTEIDCTFSTSGGPDSLRDTLVRIREEAEEAVRSGAIHLVLSDEKMDADDAPMQDAKALGRLLAASLAPTTAGAEAGELFTYTSKGKVDLKRGQAALVPILLESLEGGERILYFRRDLSRHPQPVKSKGRASYLADIRTTIG